jgi:hypothetical protein
MTHQTLLRLHEEVCERARADVASRAGELAPSAGSPAATARLLLAIGRRFEALVAFEKAGAASWPPGHAGDLAAELINDAVLYLAAAGRGAVSGASAGGEARFGRRRGAAE